MKIRLALRHAIVGASAFALFGFSAACSSDEGESKGPIELGESDFVLATTVFSPEGETSFVSLIDDPAREREIGTENALELGGAVSLFAADRGRVFALGSSDAPTVYKYEVGERGKLMETGRMSLQREGIESAFKRAELVPFISRTKAYWLDDLAEQVVIWNPETMRVTGSFSLEAASREGFVVEHGAAVMRDELLFVSASYRTEDDGEAGEALVLVIDTDRDELAAVATDDRCGETVEVVRGDDGALYFGSGVIAATLHAHRTAGYPAPCVLRINAGERTFDPDYALDLSERLEGRDAGRLVSGRDDTVYVLALHPDLLEEQIGPETELWAPYEANAWRWWRIDLASDEPGVLVEDAPVGSASANVLRAGGRDYIALFDRETLMTRFLLPEEGTLRRGLKTPGVPYGLVALR